MIEPDFDWVTARASCSPSTVLKTLEGQSTKDVALRNDLCTVAEKHQGIQFGVEPGRDSFHVSIYRGRTGYIERLAVASFAKTSGGILVSYEFKNNQPPKPIDGKLTLGNDGDCLLRVNESGVYTFWQFRKLALEPIFFNLASE